ncbi:glycoside hydrolase domain-containing protein [Bacillus pinisoli]|uniref:glycoside hydrolase domain-containing protein n=1 Tax=Bacillus pinisoli TaxID=2901866 RepID=UPI001FF67B09|nr:glycoside hydrolase domain-containing protein [Bacillus pinisoli]
MKFNHDKVIFFFLFVSVSLGALLCSGGNHSNQTTPQSQGQPQIVNAFERFLTGNVQGLLDNQTNNNLLLNNTGNDSNELTHEFSKERAVEVTNRINNKLKNSTPNSEEENTNADGNNSGNTNKVDLNSGDLPEIIWGIDSASETTEEFYRCVSDNFGNPVVFGRYLGEREGVSAGLTTEQVNLIHEKGDYILPIFNHFNHATGYEKGVTEAEEAIRFAEEVGVPSGVALFADIEPNYPVDSAFIKGWYETIAASDYKSGIYGIFDPARDLYTAYNNAVAEDPNIQENNIIWTASPNTGITTEENAPDFNPEAPEGSLAWGWQYGIDAEACNIDTNLFKREIIQSLWGPGSK